MLQVVDVINRRKILYSPAEKFETQHFSVLFEGNLTVWKVQYNIEME